MGEFDLNSFNVFMANLFKEEEAIVPIIAKDPKSAAISAIVLVGTSGITAIVNGIVAAHTAQVAAAQASVTTVK